MALCVVGSVSADWRGATEVVTSVADAVGPRREDLAPAGRTELLLGVPVNNIRASHLVGAQAPAGLDHDGLVVARFDGPLLTGWTPSACCEAAQGSERVKRHRGQEGCVFLPRWIRRNRCACGGQLRSMTG